MTTKTFHLGDILTAMTGRLVSPGGLDGACSILGWMTGESVARHQIPRVGRECQDPLRAQHPDLAGIVIPDGLDSEEKVLAWLATVTAVYGETRPVAPLAAVDHTHIDPVTELLAMRAGERTIIVQEGGK